MGEIAEMMLEGMICDGCGEFLGEGDGYPQRCAGCGGNAALDDHRFQPNRMTPGQHAAKKNTRQNRERHEAAKAAKPIECKDCHRLFRKEVGLRDHRTAVHPTTPTANWNVEF